MVGEWLNVIALPPHQGIRPSARECSAAFGDEQRTQKGQRGMLGIVLVLFSQVQEEGFGYVLHMFSPTLLALNPQVGSLDIEKDVWNRAR